MSTHRIDLTGDYDTTIYDAARRLLAEGAVPADTIEIARGGVLSMTGKIGECAKWQVVFRASGPRLAPHQGCLSAPPAPGRPMTRNGTMRKARHSWGCPYRRRIHGGVHPTMVHTRRWLRPRDRAAGSRACVTARERQVPPRILDLHDRARYHDEGEAWWGWGHGRTNLTAGVPRIGPAPLSISEKFTSLNIQG
jgi:hypothetical protein